MLCNYGKNNSNKCLQSCNITCKPQLSCLSQWTAKQLPETSHFPWTINCYHDPLATMIQPQMECPGSTPPCFHSYHFFSINEAASYQEFPQLSTHAQNPYMTCNNLWCNPKLPSPSSHHISGKPTIHWHHYLRQTNSINKNPPLHSITLKFEHYQCTLTQMTPWSTWHAYPGTCEGHVHHGTSIFPSWSTLEPGLVHPGPCLTATAPTTKKSYPAFLMGISPVWPIY